MMIVSGTEDVRCLPLAALKGRRQRARSNETLIGSVIACYRRERSYLSAIMVPRHCEWSEAE
jgi:hypothetical protein